MKKVLIPLLIGSLTCLPQVLSAKGGRYVAGDFHNHTVFTDGSTSIDRITDEAVGTYDLDWFIQSGHGGGFSRDGRYDDFNYDCTDEGGKDISWEGTVGVAGIKGDPAGTGYCDKPNMWRWQSLQEYAYPTLHEKALVYRKPIAQGFEYQVPGHEHCSHGNIAGQFDARNADALAQFAYLFDYKDNDTSGGEQGWTDKIANIGDGPGAGDEMHEKAVASVEWLQANYPDTSYVVWAHIERKGAFDPDKAYSTGYNVEHFRDFNNAGPDVAFGWEGEPGHQASGSRGGFSASPFEKSFGGTYGGVGYYSATIGHMWDALLGEGRNWWFFGSSDWHSRGGFSPNDSATTSDFWPGEFQKDYIHVAHGKPTPQDIIDGLRSGNSYVVMGDLIDKLKFIAKSKEQKATMGQTLNVKAGDWVKIKIKVRDPQGANRCPYTFDNPSLAQVGILKPINEPVLEHIDLIMGEVTGKIDPDDDAYTDPTNDTTAVIERFEGEGSQDENGYMTYVYWIRVDKSMYFRLRGTNIPVGTPYETDVGGNPLADSLAGNIACPDCPAHCNGVLDYDVEAWSDLWFISNPIFVMVE